MFRKELKNFKKKVEKEMYFFFGMTPEQVSEEIEKMKIEYGKFCDLDKDTFDGLFSVDYKEILLKYKTLVYFDGTYKRLIEIENFFKEAV